MNRSYITEKNLIKVVDLTKAIDESGYTRKFLCEKLNISVKTLYNREQSNTLIDKEFEHMKALNINVVKRV